LKIIEDGKVVYIDDFDKSILPRRKQNPDNFLNMHQDESLYFNPGFETTKTEEYDIDEKRRS